MSVSLLSCSSLPVLSGAVIRSIVFIFSMSITVAVLVFVTYFSIFASGRLRQDCEVLFEEVGRTTASKIEKGEFDAQTFSKMRHRCPVLFEEVARAALPMSSKGEINAQDLTNVVFFFVR